MQRSNFVADSGLERKTKITINENYQGKIIQSPQNNTFSAKTQYYLNTLPKGNEISPFQGIQGIRFDKDDNLWVASAIGNSLSIVDTANGKVKKVYGYGETSYGTFQGVHGPDDMVFKDGWIYYSSITTGQVERLNLKTGDVELVAQNIFGADSIALSSEGRLVVGGCFFGDGLWEIRLDKPYVPGTGYEVRPIVLPLNPAPYQSPKSYYNFNASDFDHNHPRVVYSPLPFRNKIVKVDISQIDGPPVAFDENNPDFIAVKGLNPIAVKFDPQEPRYFYALDWANGNVWRVDSQNPSLDINVKGKLVITLERGLDNLTFNSRGDMYISNHYGAIYHVYPHKRKYRVVRKASLGPAADIAILDKNNTDPKLDTLVVADLFGVREYSGSTGKETDRYPNDLSFFPQIISISDDGYIADLSSGSLNIKVHRKEGPSPVEPLNPYLGTYPLPNTIPSIPRGVAWHNGDLIVGDVMRGLMRWKLNEDKTAIVSQEIIVPPKFLDFGAGPQPFPVQYGHIIVEGNTLYFLEPYDINPLETDKAGKVWKVDLITLTKSLVIKNLGADNGNPHSDTGTARGIAMDVNGDLLIVMDRVKNIDAAGKIMNIYGKLLRINPNNPSTPTVVAEGFASGLVNYFPSFAELSKTPTTVLGTGITVSKSGAIYLTADDRGEIVRLKPIKRA